jgi:hypothetical protein
MRFQPALLRNKLIIQDLGWKLSYQAGRFPKVQDGDTSNPPPFRVRSRHSGVGMEIAQNQK